MKPFALFIFAAMLFILPSCDHTNPSNTGTNSGFALDSVKAEIAASNATFGEAFVKGDSSLLINKYTTDGCIMPAGTTGLCGAGPIGEFFNGGYAMGIRNITITTDEVMGGPEIVIETGKYNILDSSGNSLDKGKFMVAWKQENGKWKMHRDIWTTDTPAPMPK